MRRIEPIRIPREIRWLVTIMEPAFWTWLLDWWRENRYAKGRHPQKIELLVTAFRDDLGIEPILPRPKHRTFRGKPGP